MTTLEILTAIRDAIAALPRYEHDADVEFLFDAVELAANRNLPRQFQELLIVKKRTCLVVPVAIHRTTMDDAGGLHVLGNKFAELAIIYSDQAYFKPSQAATFGSEKNLGLFGIDELIETALTGQEISPYGGIVLANSQPVLFTEKEAGELGGRQAWSITAFVPIGLIATAVA